MPATGTPTANEILVTQQAAGHFMDTAGQISQAIANVLDGGQQLSATAMITTAGAKFGTAVGHWCESAEDIVNILKWMSEQLGATAQQLQASNQQSEEMAAGLPSFGNFSNV
jgi:uncharacterized protein YukE